MPAALVTCANEAHLRAFVCKLLADKIGFSVYPSNLSVRFDKDADDPTYADRALSETAGGEVNFDFDTEESRGRLAVGIGSYGPTITVNGQTWGYVDMFHASPSWTQDPPVPALSPQLLLFSPHNDDEFWLKVFVEPDSRMTAVIHRDAGERGGYHPRAVHSDGSDRIYTAHGDPAETVR